MANHERGKELIAEFLDITMPQLKSMTMNEVFEAIENHQDEYKKAMLYSLLSSLMGTQQ